jgi:hypothetical protein
MKAKLFLLAALLAATTVNAYAGGDKKAPHNLAAPKEQHVSKPQPLQSRPPYMHQGPKKEEPRRGHQQGSKPQGKK